MASRIPFSGATRPANTSESSRRRSNGAPSRVSPLWMIAAQSASGRVAAWCALIATRWAAEPCIAIPIALWSIRPWNVAITGTGQAGATSSVIKSRCPWMTSNSPRRERSIAMVAVAIFHGSLSTLPLGRSASGTVTTRAPPTVESPEQNVVTWWPRRSSPSASSAMIRSVPP